ncbi:MAG: hypothetical protein KKD92_13425 [Proteobacteria bacterium]|nr:hypothetical protein [Pseudomonadota bacterium]
MRLIYILNAQNQVIERLEYVLLQIIDIFISSVLLLDQERTFGIDSAKIFAEIPFNALSLLFVFNKRINLVDKLVF